MGCLMCSRKATEPHPAYSSIMQASSVTCPSRSGKPPRPTLRFFKSSSEFITPFSTASNALPPAERIFHASAFAGTPCFHVEITMGFVTSPVENLFLPNDLLTDKNAALIADHFKKFLR